MSVQKKSINSGDTVRWILISGLVVVAFFGAYRFASARSSQGGTAAASAVGSGIAQTGAVPAQTAGGPGTQGGSAGGSGCACCGGSGAPTSGGVTGTPIEGVAKVDGGVQKIAVQVTTTYSPNVLKLKAGVPAEITFSAAQGCTGIVQSQDLGFREDLTGGAKTVKLDNLKPGTYAFSCGMNMVFGKIVVE